jgi:hypothetical protein
VFFVAAVAIFGGVRLLNNSSADPIGAVLGSASDVGLSVKTGEVQTYIADPISQLKRTSIPLTITNNSGKILQISPGLQMQLIDSSGASYPMTAKYLSSGSVIGGPLASAKTWVSAIDFDLPSGSTAAKLIYQPDGSNLPLAIGL